MKCNVGKTDQTIRILIGILIVLIGLYFKSWWGIIGLVPIITGSIRYCPSYDILGISTCDVKKNQ
ncbi:YgaP family membrane protein [Clostridium sp.]|uniref:YgaP family membrane protein n=1 Tax=Clostridium sp. TaxID=1506 RepID=UPI003D6D932B